MNVIKGFEHKVAIKASERPVRHKLRIIPLALRDDFKKEVENMLEEGIIERTQASEWVSNIVVVRKKSGKIRLSIDLRGVKRAVLIEGHSIPHIK